MWYRVTGAIIYMPICYCACEHCEGHLDNPATLHVDQVLQADDPTEAEKLAADAALNLPLSYHGTEIKDWDWDTRPYTIELPEDQFLRLIEAPELIKEPSP